MARHRGGAPGAVARDLARWVGPKPKKRQATVSDNAFVKDLELAEKMLEAGEWSKATGRLFVALYADLHFRVYGVAPVDLGPRERVFAARAATVMLERTFADAAEMARFVAWTWSRERERENWRRENGKDGGRIDWRLQFGNKLVPEFRISEARKKAG
jgi:hypothetical protein